MFEKGQVVEKSVEEVEKKLRLYEEGRDSGNENGWEYYEDVDKDDL